KRYAMLFFFSSRRRHTRFSRDWSSDVCSSDLGSLQEAERFSYNEYERFKERQFAAFKQTEAYKKLKAELLKDGRSDELIDSFLRSFVTDYTSKILVK